MANCDEVIDLTDSFILVDHSSLPDDIIIVDTDDSFNTTSKSSFKPPRKSKKPSVDTKSVSLADDSDWTLQKRRNSNKFGECPICCEELGKNPLASTKCGHVYCLKCIEQSLRFGKQCPSCRTVLKGPSAYHPLYFNSH